MKRGIIPIAQRIRSVTRHNSNPGLFETFTSILPNYPDLTSKQLASKWAVRAHRINLNNLNNDLFLKGIEARGTSESIKDYVLNNQPSVYISTSDIGAEATTAAKFGFGINSYMLLIDRAGAITVSVPELSNVFRSSIEDAQDETADLADQENEISFIDKVAPESILGARKVYGLLLPYMYTGEFQFNPNYKLSTLPEIQIASKNNKENEEIQKLLMSMGKLPSDKRILYYDEAQELMDKIRIKLPTDTGILLPGIVVGEVNTNLTLNQIAQGICDRQLRALEAAKPEPEKVDRGELIDTNLQQRLQQLKKSELKLDEKQEKSQQLSQGKTILSAYTTTQNKSEEPKDKQKEEVKATKTESATVETDKKSKTTPKK